MKKIEIEQPFLMKTEIAQIGVARAAFADDVREKYMAAIIARVK